MKCKAGIWTTWLSLSEDGVTPRYGDCWRFSDMKEYIIIGLLLLLIEICYLQIVKRLRIVDKPHLQSSHKGAVVRGGGILFYIAYLLWFFIYGMPYPMIFSGLTIMAITSFADDIHSISPKIRLVLQFVAMIVMLYETHVFNLTLQSLLLLSVVCVGIVNIFNFMDGINGMTGGCSLVVLLALMGVNLFFLEFIDNHLLVYMLLADIVFCFFNFRKHAKCFAGDVGSLSLGMIVVFLLLKLMFADGHMHWITFVSVYLVDGGLTILHRLMLKENILTPHKKHAYQIMANELKMPHLAVSGLYMTLQALCCIWFIVSPSNTTLVLQFVLLVAIYLVFMQKCYRLHEEKR
jgi:UDP-N-acetylmuramyl pentapeptide phosphotransferase/UDP-N-acetylglucosamine-1-phosphate transferase